jgi:hypothetical protein
MQTTGTSAIHGGGDVSKSARTGNRGDFYEWP